MNLLLDTHLLIWMSSASDRLSAVARDLIEDRANRVSFSAASLWEVAIKFSLRRPDFTVEPRILRKHLLDRDFEELAVTGDHAILVDTLPMIHREPFDRLLLAQAVVEGMTLLTTDAKVAAYPGPILRV